MKRIYGFVAMALSLVACNKISEADIQLEGKAGQGAITITAQLAPKSAITKAVADNGDSKITVAWAENEHVAVLYNKDGYKKADAVITAVDESGTATISFTVVEGTSDNTECTLVYPYAAAKDDNSGVKTYSEFLSSQDGSLNANLDVRVGAGKIQVTTPGLEVTTEPIAQYAIFKFTLTDNSSSAINAYMFAVKNGSNELITEATPETVTNVLYVALPEAGQNTTYKFSANDGIKSYTQTITNAAAAIAKGTFYQATLNMGAGTELTALNLAEVSADTVVPDGYRIYGTLNGNYKISIAAGATVTLDGVTILGTNNSNYKWAGLNCEGDATIIMKAGTTNTVKGFYHYYPGIHVPSNKTLTIQGDGSLNASSSAPDNASGSGAGIGAGSRFGSGPYTYIPCGNIVIAGGTITATGGNYAAGIGGGHYGACGTITITGGTITATGGTSAAGIGGGHHSACGSITITNTVTKLTAKRGSTGANSIGAGDSGSCGTVTTDGFVGVINTSPITFPAPIFAVSSSKRVYFSPGNLQAYNATANTTSGWVWRFAEHQYDYIGANTANTNVNNGKISAAGTVDLFIWSNNKTYYGIHYGFDNDENGDLIGGLLDWGGNTIENGSPTTGWYTLSSPEWYYLAFNRNASRVHGTNNARFTLAQITGVGSEPVDGLILFPNWVVINDSDVTSWGVINKKSTSRTVCTEAQWNGLAEKGCVFLPLAETRDRGSVSSSGYGSYWTSTNDDEYYPGVVHCSAYRFRFGSSNVAIDHYGKQIGMSVRLVRDFN